MPDVFLGTVVLDALARPDDLLPRAGSKRDSLIVLRLGGGAVNAAREYQRSARESPVVAAITGNDPLGHLAWTMLQQEFPNCHRIPTATQTRVSLIVPSASGRPGESTIYTSRSQLDAPTTLSCVEPLLRDCQRLLSASMTADDADLVQALLDRHDGQTLMLLTDSQIADRPRALALAQRVGLAQLNAAELARFSRVPLWEIPRDIVRGINRLREEGLSSIIVTAGDAGVFAFVRDRWWYAAPHVVPTVNDVGAGDTLAGAVLAGLARNMEFDEVLRAAAAAAALHVSGQDRAGGWDQLEAFRAGTPTRPFTKKRVARPFVNDRHVAKLVRPLAYVAAGVLTTVAAVSLWR